MLTDSKRRKEIVVGESFSGFYIGYITYVSHRPLERWHHTITEHNVNLWISSKHKILGIDGNYYYIFGHPTLDKLKKVYTQICGQQYDDPAIEITYNGIENNEHIFSFEIDDAVFSRENCCNINMLTEIGLKPKDIVVKEERHDLLTGKTLYI